MFNSIHWYDMLQTMSAILDRYYNIEDVIDDFYYNSAVTYSGGFVALSDKYKDNSIYYKNGKLKSDAEYSIQIYIRSAEREGFDDLVKQIKKEYNIV